MSIIPPATWSRSMTRLRQTFSKTNLTKLPDSRQHTGGSVTEPLLPDGAKAAVQAPELEEPLQNGDTHVHHGIPSNAEGLVHEERLSSSIGSSSSSGGSDLEAGTLDRRAYPASKPRSWRRLLLSSTVAATISGFMGAVSSIPGPPLIILYRFLEVPHKVVRATNPALYLIMPRFFIYLAMGLYDMEHIWLYVAVALGGLAGMAVGDRLHHVMNGEEFSNILLALLFVSCALMFFSAAGLVK